jgi:hypothetical protein
MAPSRVISVPKTDPGAYNPKRPAGKLLLAQVAHLRDALSKHVDEKLADSKEATEILAFDIASIKTEADVSNYTQKVTAILHPQGAKRPGK